MGNTSSESKSINETNKKSQETLNTLKQGIILLENRSTIANTETNRLEGFADMTNPSMSISYNTVIKKLNTLQTELQVERKELERLENDYKNLVEENTGSNDDIDKIKTELDEQHNKVKTLTTEINNYFQNVAIPEINDIKHSLQEKNNYIDDKSNKLVSDEDVKIPAIYYALNENVHIIERMRYYWYVVYLIVFLGVIIALYMMGISVGTVAKQVEKVPQTINKEIQSIL